MLWENFHQPKRKNANRTSFRTIWLQFMWKCENLYRSVESAEKKILCDCRAFLQILNDNQFKIMIIKLIDLWKRVKELRKKERGEVLHAKCEYINNFSLLQVKVLAHCQHVG